MSLFGDNDAAPSTRPKSSLFSDDAAAVPNSSKTNASIFPEDTANDSSSPWDMPTPKKNARRNLIRTLLANADVPELYIDTFDNLQSGGVVSEQVAKGLVGGSEISQRDQSKIWEIVGGGVNEGALGRGEFNVLLALIGLAQEGEDLSLDAVDERRRKLPTPSLPAPKSTAPPAAKPSSTPTPTDPQPGASPRPARGFRKPSFGTEADPWGSPAMHKGHNPFASNGTADYTNGSSAPQRTTSSFTTTAAEPADASNSEPFASQPPDTSEGTAWGGYGSQPDGFLATSARGDGFDDDGNGVPSSPPRAVRTPRGASGKGVEEVVTVNLLEEKEGMFMFQHRNYEVASVRRNSKVIRRYSDFVWLLDCLHKRYPFRQLPLLPPKRVAINGNHIAADSLFIEKRRRGLARFANALVRHPVLNQEQLVVMFLTVPTELAVWRKQATISVQEEFVGKTLPPTLEDALPPNLQDTFDTVRSGVRRSADIYINLCNMMERLTKRKDGMAVEYLRFSLALQTLTEASSDTYNVDTNDVPLLNEGIKSTAKHLFTTQSLLEDEARAWDEGVLEDLKRQRDCLVSMRDVFDRRDRYAKDSIPQLERRIQTNESKLSAIRSKGDLAKAGEAEKVEDAIIKDKQSIVNQHARGIFIKQCMRDELLSFQHSQYQVSRLHQDWAQERVKYAELQADNWRALSEEVNGMPLGD